MQEITLWRKGDVPKRQIMSGLERYTRPTPNKPAEPEE